ncbi:MAG TPA: glycosyltransferase family 2 protein [Candidatus Acidoferrales bacterium]|nr:glycosyltransferase family 2 protein [Candidatus Acidoferrales bacterium]
MNTPTKLPLVSAIVPARNEEENIARAVESLAAQDGLCEIIVINDQSTDRTGAILSELAARIPALRVLDIDSLPEGWVGKNYALWRGSAEARGEWLLFTDADAVHLKGSTQKAMEIAAETGAELVSFSPEQEMKTWWERALIPFVFARLGERFRYRQVNDPKSPFAAANGQYILIKRDAYQAIGGHRAISGEVVEDVALAYRAKSAGHRVYFAPGTGIVRTRMYTTFGAMWQGWVKNLYPLMGGSPRNVAWEILTVFPLIPFVMMALGVLHWIFLAAGLTLLAGRHIRYAVALRSNQKDYQGIQYYVPAVFMYCATLITSWRRYSKGSVIWKGREYPVGSVGRS